jgi:hypothetical protein
MKKFIIGMVSAGLLTTGVFAEANLTVDMATAYVFRGTTLVDDLVIMPGMELSGFGMDEKYGMFTLGALGYNAPFNDDTPVAKDTMFKTDWYLNYALPQLVENMDLYIQMITYQYSGSLPAGNETELNLGIGYQLAGFYLGGSANFMVDDKNPLTEDQKYFDFFADYLFELNEKSAVTVGALIGIMFQGDGNSAAPLNLDDGFNQFELDAAYTYALGEMWSLGASIAYIGQLDSNVLSDAAYDKGLVAMFSLGCDL